MWTLKNKTNEQTTKENQIHRYKQQTGGCQKEGGKGMSEIGEGDYPIKK